MVFRAARAALVMACAALLGAGTVSAAALPASDSPEETAAALMKRAVTVQTEFVQAAVRYEQATSAAVRAQQAAVAAQQVADEARVAGEAAQRELGQYAARLYQSGGLGAEQPIVGLVGLLQAEDPAEYLHAEAGLEYLSDQRGHRVRALLDTAGRARQKAQDAATARAVAERAERAASVELDRIQSRAETLSVEIDEALAKVGNTGGLVSAEQAAMNVAAKQSWAGYTAALSKAKVTPPPASALVRPDRLPKPLQPYLDADGKPVPGAAAVTGQGAPLRVISREAVAAVAAALAQVGKPYVADQAGPEAYDCGGLASAAWGRAGVSFSPGVQTQWVTGRKVPAGQVQPGDLVFLADPGAGVHHVGVAVAPSLMVAASAQTFVVGVEMIPADPWGVVRPSLPSTTINALPKASGAQMRCGAAVEPPTADASAPDVLLGSLGGQSFPSPTRSGRAWGGYANGMIPASALCPIGDGQERLRCDAARAFNALDAAYRAEFGDPICISDGYRSYPDQIRVFRQTPHLAAVPGTSNHGWGLATDLGCGINQFSSAPYRWMKQHAGRFGFVHPGWAEPGGSKPEPWHWEYGRLS